MRAISLPLMFLLLPSQEAPNLDKLVDELVEQLKDLSPDANRAQFLGRPALSKLMALGPKALPRLKHHFLDQQDWRLKVSVGYLAVLLGRSDTQVHARWSALCKDPDIFVRVLMISLTDQFATGSCYVEKGVADPKEQLVWDRVRPDTDLGWMSKEDLKSLAINSLVVLKEGKLLVHPPVLNRLGAHIPDDNPKRLRSSGVRLLTPIAQMAEVSLLRIMDTPAGHDVMRLVFECTEADDGSDAPRLGHLFRMTSSSLWHRSCGERNDGRPACALFEEYKRRLFALCEKWAWKVTDPNAQYGVLWALDCIGLWKAYDLRERLSKEHPDPQVRELAGSNLNRLWNNMYDRGHTREQEAVDDRRLEESMKKR